MKALKLNSNGILPIENKTLEERENDNEENV